MSYEDLRCDECGGYGDIICIECELAGWQYCFCDICIETHSCYADGEGEAVQEAKEGA
jgi:hypothetical protein